MVAAVAATMASASTFVAADISIKGDAYLQYSSNKIKTGTIKNTKNTNNRKRVNLNVTGKSGATKVVASLRYDDKNAEVNQTGTASGQTDQIDLHQFYLTTKVGPVSIKAGDFYGTIGLGAWSKGAPKKDALSISTKIGGWKLGLFTRMSQGNVATTATAIYDNNAAAVAAAAAINVIAPGTATADNASVTVITAIANTNSDETNVSVSGKIGGAAVKLINNPSSKWTDISAKGTFNGISVAAESFTKKAQGTSAKQKVTLIHVGGKANGIKWDVAQYKNKDAVAGSNAKFAPLGSMLVGKSARGGTNTAAANAGDFSKILGVAASTKFAGNTVKAILTKPTLGANDKVNGTELILTRPMSGGKLTVNMAKLSGAVDTTMNATNTGLRFDVKF